MANNPSNKSNARKSNRSGRSGPSGGGGQNAKQGGSPSDGSRRRRKGSRKKKVDPTAFWGDPDKLTQHDAGKALITSNPSAVVQSLGRPPLSGHQNAADHYFVAVYDRAVNLAAALATAGNLIEAEDLASKS